MTRPMLNFSLGVVVGLIIGVAVGKSSSQSSANQAVTKAPSVRVQENDQSDPATRWNGEYASISGNIYDLQFDQAVFRLSNQIGSDLDAQNVYLWAQNRIYEFRTNERVTLNELNPPLIARKPFLTVMAELVATTRGVQFSIMATGPMSVDDAIDKTIEWAKQMETRRLKIERNPQETR
jgi:hypothetical protein